MKISYLDFANAMIDKISLNDKEIGKMLMDVLNGLLQVIKKENNL